MAEIKEFELARTMLRQTPVFLNLKHTDPEKILALDHLLQKSTFDPNEAYPNTSKEKRRAYIAAQMKAEIANVAPSRLMSMTMQALKWQQHVGLLPKGLEYDLFRGIAPEKKEDQDKFPSKNEKVIKVFFMIPSFMYFSLVTNLILHTQHLPPMVNI